MWQANYPKRFEPFTRLSNNPVENWFKILKHQILREQVKPSQHSSRVYKHLLVKYFEHYKPNDELLKAYQYSDKSKINKKDTQEIWKSKGSTNARRKGFYYTNNLFSENEMSFVKSVLLTDIFDSETNTNQSGNSN